MSDLNRIRNFCIIAHIDHGKSTLADRLLELTGTVSRRDMHAQVLDQMDIERERGITVKLAPVRMHWKGLELNLIDTPGHVDFSYEVSRSLAAVEGALLIVDATQGVQAQTIANLELAKAQGLTIIPIINKIDLPNADVAKATAEILHLLPVDASSIECVSAKTGEGVERILDRIIKDVPPPTGNPDAPLRALIFDSVFDSYQGVIAYVRIVDGRVTSNASLDFVATRGQSQSIGVGRFAPKLVPEPELQAGQIGYIITGLKSVRQAHVGDTITISGQSVKPLPGYREVVPMVFTGLFTTSGDDAEELREALEKLHLNDASLVYEPEHSPALGYGFRCGFLGLLHLDIVQERLRREYQLDVIVTVPSVAYHVFVKGRTEGRVVHSPLDMPDPAHIERIEEPMMDLSVVAPTEHIGHVMDVLVKYRGEFNDVEYLDPTRAVIHANIPLASILVDFYDTVKSATAGYASVNYTFSVYRPADVVRLDILVAGTLIDSLASMVYRDASVRAGRAVALKLKDILPRQMFEVKIQAAIGGKIIASESISAMRKDVTAKLYGGDVTRKRKLLEKQKKGKKRMKNLGKVDIPQSAFLAVLKH